MQAFGLAKFVGQNRGDRSARRKQGIGHAVGIANDKSHGHGLAQGTTQAQHDAADHTGLGVRQHHLAHHLPCGASQAISRLTQDGGRDLKHIAHHGRHKRQHHESQNDAGRQNAQTVGGTAKQPAHQGHAAQHRLQRYLQEIGIHGREHKQTKHAVDDGRHSRQQLDGRAQWAAQPYRAGFSQKNRNAKGQRHRQQHGNTGTQHRTDDRYRGAKFLVDDVPLDVPQKMSAKFGECGPSIHKKRNDDAHQGDQHQKRKRLGGPVKNKVL